MKKEDRYSVIRNHLHIVSCGDTGNALGVVRSLGEIGIKPIVLCVRENHLPCLIKSKYIGRLIWVEGNQNPVDILLQYFGNEPIKPFVYTCDDYQGSIYDNRYEELIDKFYFFHCERAGRINELQNKETICKVAESCGIRIPKEEVVHTGELPKTLQYPIITKTLKSTMGLWKGDSYICHNEKEYVEACKKIQSPKLLLQEYVHKKNEVAVEGFSVDGGRTVYAPFQISFLRLPEDRYGEYMYVKPTQSDVLEKVTKIIKECKFEGCFEVEFLLDKNEELVFLEVNFRYSFWNYAVTYGGINYPAEWALATKMCEEGAIPPPEAFAKQGCRELFTAICEPGDFGQSVQSGKISIWQWIKDIINADMCYFWNAKDPMPAISFWWHKLLRYVKK